MPELKIQSIKNHGKIVYIPISFIRLIFDGGLLLELSDDGERFINVPVIDGVPEDASLVFVVPFPERDAIGLKFLHESFEPTLEGNCFPEVVMKELTFKRVKVIERSINK